MNPAVTIWKKELLDNLRDRRTLFTALVMPVIVMPAILIGSLKLGESQVKKSATTPAKVIIIDAATAPTLVAALRANPTITIVQSVDYRAAISAGTANIALGHDANFEQDLATSKPAPLTIYEKSSILDSSSAVAKVEAAINTLTQSESLKRVAHAGLPTTTLTVVTPTTVDLATNAERGGFFIGLLLPMFIVLFAILGGMYIAIDVSAGEKERKTLEALLYAPISRLKIVLGKFLAVTTMAMVTIILSITSIVAAFKFFPPNFGQGTFVITLTPGAIGLMLGVGTILAVMFSGMLLSVSIFAKSYKEAQNYITPFYLLAVLPSSIATSIPEFKPATAVFLIPGVNATLLLRETFLGTYNTSHILATFGSLLVFAVVGILVAAKIYGREDVLFRE